ncbi:LPS export ABC transporter periplasmic protein LptC [Leptolyngbya sp. PCC 6406]|uniref:LPS export ABC transporter periplasmic protein LptC n=1 Tax=Leptolyngbya sp. PCC 6406 TaxID=1173264 RepID=UPI0002ABB38E|nr:LPS export ABC transporter periplasmic protein LptC [Leptolyngbya sp. PCC 6406]
MKRAYWLGAGAVIVGLALVVGLRALRQGPGNDYLPEDQQAELETGLTLRDVTLEQPDDDGNILWRVKAETVTYSVDKRVAVVKNPEGELYQDGELLYRVEGQEGEIRENGEFIFLRGNIVARGIQNKVVLRGNEMEWRTQVDVMILRDRVTGTHPQLRAAAEEVRVYDRVKRMDLLGDAIANTVVEDPKIEPWLKLQADALRWHWEAEEVESKQPLRVERFLNETITEVTTSDRGFVDLANAQVTLTSNVLVQLLTLSLKIASEQAIWNVEQEQVVIDTPLKIDSDEQATSLTAQQGRLDLAADTVHLSRAVEAISARNNGRLTTDNLTWNLADQTVLAEGNVNYQQGDPSLTVRGPRALGRIEAQTVVFSGGGGGQVVTEIVTP